MSNVKNKRILLKLSGEALKCGKDDIYDSEFVDKVAEALVRCVSMGYEIAVVLGAGNIWRGRQGGEMDRTDADRMGMLATVINAICMKDAIKRAGVDAHVMTAIPMSPFAEPYSAEAAVSYLEKGATLEDGYITKPSEIELLDDKKSGYITLVEGKYHQIKRMLESVNNKITYLERITFGPLVLDENLERGQWRFLTENEIKELEEHR
jgi:hypothetical protein